MATQTTGNLKLSKPEGTDKIKEFRAPYNSNLDKIDEAVSAQSQQIAKKENKLIGRTVAISAATSSGTIGSISGDSAITSSMVVVASTITNLEYQTSNWTINTTNGGLTITGTASAATSVYIVLAEV